MAIANKSNTPRYSSTLIGQARGQATKCEQGVKGVIEINQNPEVLEQNWCRSRI